MSFCIKDTPAWIINLDRCQDRWVRCFRSLSSIFPAERLRRISAVDGKDFTSPGSKEAHGWHADKLRALQREGYAGPVDILDPVRTALCLSHQRALHAFLQSGEKWGIFFEDDARPAEMIARVSAEGGLLHPPKDAEVLFLHDRVHSRGAPADATPLAGEDALRWRIVRGGIGLEAYAVNEQGARKILKAWRPVFFECDLQLMTFMEGYAETGERARMHALFVKNGGLPPPAIRAYACHQPLFQTDHWVPSVKFATIADASQTQKQVPRGNGASRMSGRINLNTMEPLGLATVWFNPAHYQSRRDNFAKFYKEIGPFADRILIIELAFQDQPWQLPDIPNLLRLRSNTVCWQKEALLNYAFDHLAHAGFKNLGWLDADIIFSSDDWYEKAVEVLEKKRLCQLFSEIETHFPDLGRRIVPAAAYAWAAKAQSPLSLGETGFGWAMKKEVWEAARLFDMDVVGGGDYTMWQAVFANYLSPDLIFWNHACTPEFKEVRAEWARRWSAAVAMEVGYVPGVRVKSLPHGTIEKRNYHQRGGILRKHQYAPLLHMRRDDAGLLEWTNDASQDFRESVHGYFYERAEDSGV